MMAQRNQARTEPIDALAKRLETLTGEDGGCCVDDLQAVAAKLRGSKPFAAALARAKALGDERRLLALSLLKRRGELCACEIQAALGLTHATVSHHMSILTEAGLVEAERKGKWMHYRLAEADLPLP